MDRTENIIAERKITHGDYRKQSLIAQQLKTLFQSHDGYRQLDAGMREGLDMIAVKIARILAGNCTFQDHWEDICGYARLVSNDVRLQSQLSAVAADVEKKLSADA